MSASLVPASGPHAAAGDLRQLHVAGGHPMARRRRRNVRTLVVVDVLLAIWYFSWLLSSRQIGTPWVYGLLVAAEIYNLIQATGFWWTVLADGPDAAPPVWTGPLPDVDVLIPVYNEALGVVEPTVAAATRLLGARVRVFLLDDGDRPVMAELAARFGAVYVTREEHSGAKAGNINHALGVISAPFVAVFDCDHVPSPEFLLATLGHLQDEKVAFVQTPQSYANRHAGAIAAASASQQDLFFGVIGRGKAAKGAMFCCGTNVLFRRAALDEVGGFPENSVTEDFELSMHLHEAGWESAYVHEVLAQGLGPEDMLSYVSQQGRWAQGCLSALPRVLRSRLPLRLRVQYLLSASYFLSGWTVLVYMSLPVLRIFGGLQPIHQLSANAFLVHFVPYFGACVLTIAVASDGTYSFGAYSLAAANFGVHIRASLKVLFRRQGRFVVTPKHGAEGRQLRPIAPALVMLAVLIISVIYALARSQAPSALTNVAFASIHISILLTGSWAALRRRRPVDATVAAVDQRGHFELLVIDTDPGVDLSTGVEEIVNLNELNDLNDLEEELEELVEVGRESTSKPLTHGGILAAPHGHPESDPVPIPRHPSRDTSPRFGSS